MAENILVVEDNLDMQKALFATLKRAGYRVTICADAFEGIDAYKKGDYKLVITDMKMPDKSGIELLDEIKEMTPDIPVIMITGAGTIDTAVKAMKKGAFDYILKPFSSDKIEALIKKALDSVKQVEKGVKKSKKEFAAVDISSKNPKMQQIVKLIDSAAKSKSTVLIQGESGTGKEMIARAIHMKSPRSKGAFVAVNCAALPEGLMESELFGHERGSFTGAISKKDGKFKLADKGTLLLDEISEMPLFLQAKLLRVIQEREIDPVGSHSSIEVDVRIIATTNRDLKREVKAGKFRDDLFYRLNVIPISLPNLSERREDINNLIDYFLKKYCKENGKNIEGIEKDALEFLRSYHWPGNIRELENTIERAVVIADDDCIKIKDLMLSAPHAAGGAEEAPGGFLEVGATISEMEQKLIMMSLKKTAGNKTKAADMLGINVKTLRNKIKEYNLPV
jgi:DNA-binding NtrC family response regulator